ncbi:MAG TPA: transposase [Micromonosporaceae bacterium]
MIFVDCSHVKICDGQIANRTIYIAVAVTVDSGRDVLGLWAGGEGAKFWLRVLTEIRGAARYAWRSATGSRTRPTPLVRSGPTRRPPAGPRERPTRQTR